MWTPKQPGRDAGDAELLFEQGGLKDHRGARLALRLFRATGDSTVLDSFMEMARLRAAAVEEPHHFLGPDLHALPQGGLPLGTIILANNQPGPRVHLPVSALYRYPHILVAGPSGSGKSWYMGMQLCRWLIDSREVVWLIDSEGDFVDLAGALGPERLWVISHRQFRRNPLEPLPGEDPLAALGRVKTVFREAFFMRDGSLNLLSELVHRLYLGRGVLNGGEDYPCLRDVFEQAKLARWRLDSRRGQHGETLLSRLGNLMESMGPTYLCKRGHPIAELAAHSVVFDITGLKSRDLAHFFLDDILCWLADYMAGAA